MKTIRAYWSHQSPYCYFALDRLLALNARPDTSVELCPVLPGVIRDGTLFADRDPSEERYFLLDVARTAEFLGLPYAEADPYPVNFAPGTMYRAAADQPRVFELYNLTAAAIDIGRGWAFLDVVTRLIWDGRTPGWDQDGNPLTDFVDVRELQAKFTTQGIKPDVEADENSTGPASFVIQDPDGNPILFDQHVNKPE